MSLILRSFLRDPRPLSRAIRRLENDWFMDEWPPRKVRRSAPLAYYESPVNIMEDMSRQMVNTLNKMQEFVDDMDSLDELTSRHENHRKHHSDQAVVKRTESGGLQLALDVADFKPEDLKIKLVDDHLMVEAESESSGENSYRKSHFKRWFRLPEDCKVDEIKSKLTHDNTLVIDLPLNKPLEANNARTIPIEVAKKPAAVEGERGQSTAASGDQQPQQSHEQHHDEHAEQARRSARRA